MDHTAALIEQNRLLGVLAGGVDLSTPVPTCPDWNVRQLVTHVGRGHRWAAQIVRERADAPVDIRAVPDGKPAADVAATLAWLDESARLLVDAVVEAGADAPVWTFTGPQPAAWWVRRRLHEATVHRGDAALAAGVPYELEPEVAADGVSEWLGLVVARPTGDKPAPLAAGATLHLHATDGDLGAAGEWMLRGDGSAVTWEHGHGKGDAAVRARASDLLLAVMRRIPAADEHLQVLGDPAVWTAWLERTPF